MESKERKPRCALVVKEEVTPPNKIFKKMRLLLKEFKGVVHDELSEELPPMRDILHHNDFIPEVSLLNLPHYWMHPKKSEVSKEEIEELIHKVHNKESINFVIGLPHTEKKIDFVEKTNKKYKKQ